MVFIQHSTLSTIYKVLIAILFAFVSRASFAAYSGEVLCIDNGYTVAQGGKNCRRATIVEDTYDGYSIRGNRIGPSDDYAQMEAQIIQEANSLRCFKRLEVSDWPEKWGSIPGFTYFDENGYPYTHRTKGKGYTAIHTDTGYPNCTGPETVISASIGRKQTLKCFSPALINGVVRINFGFTLEKDGNYSFVCLGGETLLGYFNGVANTQSDADDSLRELKKLEADFPSTVARPFVYDTFLNNTACTADNKVACIADIAEVFAQRSTELDGVLSTRWEIFWELLKGNHTSADALTKTLQNKLVDTNNGFANWIISLFDAIVGKLAAIFTNVASLFTGPSTQADVAAHLAQLQKHADKGSGMVLVAHSQGNLFVNAAYDQLKSSHPTAKVEVVHVAPASPTLRGGHSLVDIDLVINALRITGISGVPAITKNIPPSDEDKTGHSFVATYMDKARAAYTEIKAMVITSVTKVAPAASN